MAIGGDATGVFSTAANTGIFPFTGKIAAVRIYGRSVTDADARKLSEAMRQRSVTYTTNNRGYAPVCVPFATVVPEGYTAYIVCEIASTMAVLHPIAEGGEVLPQGAAVILQGPEPKVSFTLTPAAAGQAASAVSLQGNLLAGTYASRVLTAGEGLYLQGAGTSFYRVTSTHTMEAFSCWLPCELKRNLTIETTTPVLPVQSSVPRPFSEMYDLSGHKVREDYKGIVIKKGHKILK